MKQKLLLFFTLCILTGLSVFAQDRTVTGTVKAKDDGLPLPGVSVKVKGTSIGTQTGADGKFSIKVPSGNKVLEFSSVGYAVQSTTLGSGNIITVSLTADTKQLGEVVVTGALGVSRKDRSIGYAAQQIKGEDLTSTKQSDLNTALAGKISGIQIAGGSGAKFGTSIIIVRGVNGIGGPVSPLYVIDGVVVDANNVNMDDVDQLTVLKGPAATSLYGQRGSNGVVVITSKKGVKRGVGIEFNHSTTFENVATMPKYQNEYGGGPSQDWNTFTFNPATDDPALQAMNGAKYYNYSVDESWGPKMDGTMYAPWYAWNKFDPEYAKQKPFLPQPNNVRDFYETGAEFNSNVAFSKVGDDYNTRVSYTNISRTGVSPNTRMDRNLLSFNGSVNPISKLTFTTNINFNTTKYFNRPGEGYGTQTAGSFNQWFHRDIEINKLRNYRNPDGTYTSWNIGGPRNVAPKYWDNPYTEAYENTGSTNYTNVYGSLGANYKITNELKVGFTARGNYYSGFSDGKVASFTLNPASYSTSQARSRENNYLLDASYGKDFGKFSLKAGAFGEWRFNHNENIAMNTVGGLTVPEFYNIGASKDRPGVSNSTFDKKVRSVYGYVSGGYKNMLFVDVNLRNDWSSSLPQGANSYLYGGVSGSFVFTELMKENPVLSFGKVFASFGRVGSDIGAYNINQVYNSAGLYGTTPAMTVPDQIPNATLKPALADSYEAGLELKFMKDMIRFSFNYYDRKTTNQIISLTLPSTTGFSSALVNAGEIANHGYEFTLGGTPIRNKNFNWDLDMNVGISKNKINSLYPGLNNFVLGSFGYVGTPSITANRQVGQPWGTLITPGLKKDANGNTLIGDDGMPIIENDHNLGTFVPKLTGGFTTNLNYKGFMLGISTDFQIGGKLFSITRENMNGSGLSLETVGLNDKGNPKRDDPANGGGILIKGIRESDGKPNTTYVGTQDYYEGYIPYVWEEYVYKATYVKLREVSLGYNLPKKWAGKFGAQRASISVVARNPWLIYTAVKGIDPSESAGTWIEGGQLPGTRTLGFNVKLSF